jgi:hypothetical protein
MQEHVDRRRGAVQQPAGLARRATDQDLRGMQIEVDNSEAAWSDWEAASSKWDDLGADTEPSQLAALEGSGEHPPQVPSDEGLRLRP